MTFSEDWKSEDCLLCGAHQPPGHVIVRTAQGRRAGRVCSEHSLKELILDSEEWFLVEVSVSSVEFDLLHRVHAKRRERVE